MFQTLNARSVGVPIPADLLNRAAAAICRLPEGNDRPARSQAILELLIEEGTTADIVETCIAIDARLEALSNLSQSPLLGAWERAGNGGLVSEIVTAAASAPIHITDDHYAFDEQAFFALVLAAAAARGAS